MLCAQVLTETEGRTSGSKKDRVMLNGKQPIEQQEICVGSYHSATDFVGQVSQFSEAENITQHAVRLETESVMDWRPSTNSDVTYDKQQSCSSSKENFIACAVETNDVVCDSVDDTIDNIDMG